VSFSRGLGAVHRKRQSCIRYAARRLRALSYPS
jgi:hypothetical protein